MANIQPLQTDDLHRITVITWSAMAGGDLGLAAFVGDLSPFTVQGIGDGTSFLMEGSNDGGTTWSQMTSAAVTFTFASSKTPVLSFAAAPMMIRPNMTGGTSSKVVLVGSKYKG